MKRLMTFLLLFAAIKVAGQTTGYLRFDTVKIMKQNGTCELYIQNKTKDSTGGVLTNVGNGLTSFVPSRLVVDTLFIGGDTLVISHKLDSIHVYNASSPDPDTIYQYKGGDSTLAGYIPKGALNNNNLGTGFPWLNEGTQQIKRVADSWGIKWDSTSTANSLTAKPDTTTGTGLPTYHYVDSSVAAGGGAAEGIQPTLVAGDTANRRIYFNDLSDTSSSYTFVTETTLPRTYNTVYSLGTAGLWNKGFSFYPGVNPGSGRPNIVYSPMSYNMSPGGSTRLISNEAAIGLFYESHFEMGGGNPYFERYNQIVQSDGYSYRPDFSVFRKNAREHTFTQQVTTANWQYLGLSGAADTILYSMGTAQHAFGLMSNGSLNLTNRRVTGNTWSAALDNDGPIVSGTGINQSRVVISPHMHSAGTITNTNAFGTNISLGTSAFNGNMSFVWQTGDTYKGGIAMNGTGTTEYFIAGINDANARGVGASARPGGSILIDSRGGIGPIRFSIKDAGTSSSVVGGGFGTNGNFNAGGGNATPPDELTVDERGGLANTNTVEDAMTIRRTTSGTAATGLGVRLRWTLENASNTDKTVWTQHVLWTDPVNSQEKADFVWSAMTNGAAATEKMRMTSTGSLKLNTSSTASDIDQRKIYVNGSIGAFPDSIETVTTMGSDFLQVIDATTGKFKKIHPGNVANPNSLIYSLTATTPGTTPTNMTSTTSAMSLPNNSVGIIKVHLVGNGGAGAATHKIQGIRYYTFNKNGSTLTLDAADIIMADKEGGSVTAASWQLISSSDQPVLEVTGVTSVNINWVATVEIVLVIN